MPPIFTEANYDYVTDRDDQYPDIIPPDYPDYEEPKVDDSLSQVAFMYMIALSAMLLTWLFVFFCLRIIAIRQKTRSPQERRMCVGSRSRPTSLSPQEPTIYVSPANLPPPPKYEFLAPPSYEEVVGVHYPHLQQPITQPITTAMRTEAETRNNATNISNTDSPTTVVTVSANERRTSVTVTASA